MDRNPSTWGRVEETVHIFLEVQTAHLGLERVCPELMPFKHDMNYLVRKIRDWVEMQNLSESELFKDVFQAYFSSI